PSASTSTTCGRSASSRGAPRPSTAPPGASPGTRWPSSSRARSTWRSTGRNRREGPFGASETLTPTLSRHRERGKKIAGDIIIRSHALRVAPPPARPAPPLGGEARPLRRSRAEPHAQGPLLLRGDAGPRLSRHLRDRDEPHGPEDPVRARQPPAGIR